MAWKLKLEATNVNNPRKYTTESLSTLARRVLKHRVHIVEIIHGSAVTIQALHSDVIIHVPDGVYGIILGKLCSGYWRFGCLVGDNDCVISPMYQFYFKGSEVPLGKKFSIDIPHIVKDIFKIARKIQVIHRHNGLSLQAKVLTENPSPTETYYTLSQRRVKIYTPHFCEFLVTAKGTEHCAGSMTVMAFAKMKSTESGPLATVVIYFGSSLLMCEGYQGEIMEREKWSGDSEKTEIALSADDYDKKKSSLKICISATNEKGELRWRGYRNTKMKMAGKLYEILHYHGPHLCKHGPAKRQFLLVATEERRAYELDICLKTKMYVRLGDQTEEKRKNDPCWINLIPKSISDVVAEKTGPKLKDNMVWKLAQRISSKKKLNNLALNGLKLEGYVVETHMTNESDINQAAYKTLKQWRLQYENSRVAYSRLCEILREIQMAKFVSCLET